MLIKAYDGDIAHLPREGGWTLQASTIVDKSKNATETYVVLDLGDQNRIALTDDIPIDEARSLVEEVSRDFVSHLPIFDFTLSKEARAGLRKDIPHNPTFAAAWTAAEWKSKHGEDNSVSPADTSNPPSSFAGAFAGAEAASTA